MKNDRPNPLPKARKDRLIVKELPDEVLVYDLDRDEAHCLNRTAGMVWKYCDGEKSVAQINELLAKETSTSVPEEVVLLALDQLEKFKLLDNAAAEVFQLQGMNRREVVRRVGFAALALPMIISISASPAEAQGSLLPPGRCCGNPTQCTSNNCAQTPACTPPPPAAPSTKACA